MSLQKRKHKKKNARDPHSSKNGSFPLFSDKQLFVFAFVFGFYSSPVFQYLTTFNSLHATKIDNPFCRTFNEESIDKIIHDYPSAKLTAKNIRDIKTMLTRINARKSTLVLLGQRRDRFCRYDPTFCISKRIANSSNVEFKFLDASTQANLRETYETVTKDETTPQLLLIDGLEELPPTEAQTLLNIIDSDSPMGLVLFTIYSGQRHNSYRSISKQSEAVEDILSEKWEGVLKKDEIYPILSRLISSIVEVL